MDPKLQYANPYLFCSNNPVMYVDPDGQFSWLISALVGGAMNLCANIENVDNFWDGLGYFFVGARAAALSTSISNGILSARRGKRHVRPVEQVFHDKRHARRKLPVLEQRAWSSAGRSLAGRRGIADDAHLGR